jgi:hypothetical protein
MLQPIDGPVTWVKQHMVTCKGKMRPGSNGTNSTTPRNANWPIRAPMLYAHEQEIKASDKLESRQKRNQSEPALRRSSTTDTSRLICY